MKFKRSYSNARNLGSAYKFAFGGDINRAIKESCRTSLWLIYFETESLQVWFGVKFQKFDILTTVLQVLFRRIRATSASELCPIEGYC